MLRRLWDFLRSLLRDRGGERVVFRYHDGTARVGADPLRLRAGLDAAFPEWAAAVGQVLEVEAAAGSGLPLGEKIEADLERRREELTGKLIAAVRAAFAVPEFREVRGRRSGLTDLECIDLLCDYLDWVSDLMEETRSFRTTPPSTGSAASPVVPVPFAASPSTRTASTPSEPVSS